MEIVVEEVNYQWCTTKWERRIQCSAGVCLILFIFLIKIFLLNSQNSEGLHAHGTKHN